MCSLFSFVVSLACSCNKENDEDELTDVALRLSARFAQRQFLRNAKVSGKWSEEEAAIPYFPFIQDQPFRVIIRPHSVMLSVGVKGDELDGNSVDSQVRFARSYPETCQ